MVKRRPVRVMGANVIPKAKGRGDLDAFDQPFIEEIYTSPASNVIREHLDYAKLLGFDPEDPDIIRRCIDTAVARYEASLPGWEKAEAERKKRFAGAESVVYYVRIGQLVKIGMSKNMYSRMSALNPEEIMAVEPGGRRLEMLRHKQFSALNQHSEWFRLEEPLLTHIAALPARFKQGTGMDMETWIRNALWVDVSDFHKDRV